MVQMAGKRYILKPMVMARLLAETSVLLSLLLLPVGMVWIPMLQQLPQKMQWAIFVLAGIALCLLPFYGFITWQVRIDDEQLCTRSLFKSQCHKWNSIKRLQMKTTLNWRRYVVEFEEGDQSFPLWLSNIKELLQSIRDRLPESRGGGSAPSAFRQDTVSLIVQFIRVILSILFVAVFWLFYSTVHTSAATAVNDRYVILCACLLATAIICWRCFTVITMPTFIEIGPQGVTVRTTLFKREIEWPQVISLKPSFFLLPEGYMLKTKQGRYLLSDNLNGIEELHEALTQRLSRQA
jgi:hypothetical protein